MGQMFYLGANSCVQNAWCMSNYCSFIGCVRQGCPLSPYLFIVCIDILSATLLKDHEITGIKINGKEFKSTGFADDATIAMDRSFKYFQKLMYTS